MAVNLGKSSGFTNSATITSSLQNQVNYPSDPIESLKVALSIRVFDSYCDENTFNTLIQYGIQQCGLEQKKSEIILTMELESKGITNEKMLLTELDSLLHQFTDSDKKLDEKEKNDTIQFLCKARSGYSQGLSFDVANRFITTFCRNNQVKMKVGFLKWAIP
jgi:methylaspartate ammonia-lyase